MCSVIAIPSTPPSTVCASPHLTFWVALKACAHYILTLQMRKLSPGEFTKLVRCWGQIWTQECPSSKPLLFAVSNISFTLSLCTTIVQLLPSLLSPSTCHFLSLVHAISFCLTSPLLPLSKLWLVHSISQELWNTYNMPSILLSDCFSVFLFLHNAWCSAEESTQ